MSLFHFVTSVLRSAGKTARAAGKTAMREGMQALKKSRAANRTAGQSGASARPPKTRPRKSSAKPKKSHVAGMIPATYPDPTSAPVEWNVAQRGLPHFSYRPERNNLPDPGEVVWTWVPFEENDGQGKDRPVLVLAMEGDYAIFVQLTSKDHADRGIFRDRFGTWWMDIGAGEWDSQGRPSEAKLSKLWVVHESRIRRTGSALDASTYHAVIAAIQEIFTA
ncbi:MAG: type II toxin-antitoxin system PemK/MazF family toxin [Actinomycetaceae bacterium]|nr:type II toxin-antitoxin system PemK/MazF family toxin [Actinomycetaceae bacterium]MDY5854966.1 type II toxin-antitoxin system PemK/MazF family toxin [Arcanobacterium sp.]